MPGSELPRTDGHRAHGASAAALCGQAVHRVFYRKPDAAWPVVLPGPSLEGGLEELPLY